MSNFEDVKVFMKTYGQEVKINSSFPEEKIVKLRCDLIQEELDELKIAIEQKNILVTGAGGSIGSELCLQIIRLNPSIILGWLIKSPFVELVFRHQLFSHASSLPSQSITQSSKLSENIAWLARVMDLLIDKFSR